MAVVEDYGSFNKTVLLLPPLQQTISPPILQPFATAATTNASHPTTLSNPPHTTSTVELPPSSTSLFTESSAAASAASNTASGPRLWYDAGWVGPITACLGVYCAISVCLFLILLGNGFLNSRLELDFSRRRQRGLRDVRYNASHGATQSGHDSINQWGDQRDDPLENLRRERAARGLFVPMDELRRQRSIYAAVAEVVPLPVAGQQQVRGRTTMRVEHALNREIRDRELLSRMERVGLL